MQTEKQKPIRKQPVKEAPSNIMKMTKCWIQLQNLDTRNNHIIRFVPSAVFSEWYRNTIKNSHLVIVKAEQSYWIEENLFEKSKQHLDFGVSEAVVEISVYIRKHRETLDTSYYIYEKGQESLFRDIKSDIETRGLSFSKEMIRKRKGYFIS